MISLSTSTGYAIQAMAHLDPEGSTASFIRDLAEAADVPAPYLAKLVQRLADGNLIISKRGYRGGIRLARPATQISLLEIDEAIQRGEQSDRCLLGLEVCSDERACPMHAFWKINRESIREKLSSTSLSDLMAFEAARAKKLNRKKKTV
jgi:Rrf2 family transcriptional regulator, iron-sulfur cluster assembly transcription factor